MKKRILPLVMALILIVTLAPTPAAATGTGNSVTVYFTLSNDGYFAQGNDGTVLARVPVTVEYFNIAPYGLESFYRYEADSFENGGGYIGNAVVEWPTLLHLYIQAVEEYYLAGEELNVRGYSYGAPTGAREFYDFMGNSITGGDHAMYITGGSTSLYFKNIWGHDENLMYYINHEYPLMAANWGATADYILLEDGMEIDMAMFSDWNFYNHGAFTYFEPSATTVAPGETVDFRTLAAGTVVANTGASPAPVPISGLTTIVYDSDWNILAYIDPVNGEFSYEFEDEGIYYVAGFDPDAGTMDACIAPAIATITVTTETPVNSAPVLNGTAASSVYGTADDAHAFNLATIFRDPDGDPLTYTVSIDNGTATAIPSTWSFVPPGAGVYTLVFKAFDSMDVSPEYTVTFTAGAATNMRPQIRSGVANPAVPGGVLLGSSVNIDLTQIFVDPESDAMSFEVSVNGGAFVPVTNPLVDPTTTSWPWPAAPGTIGVPGSGASLGEIQTWVYAQIAGMDLMPSDVCTFTPSGQNPHPMDQAPTPVNSYSLRFRASDGYKVSNIYTASVELVRVLGDVDFSGIVNLADAMLVYSHFTGAQPITTSKGLIAADVDFSGSINMADFQLIYNIATSN